MLLTVLAGAAAGGYFLHWQANKDFREVQKKVQTVFTKGGLFLPLSKTAKAYPRVREIKLVRMKTKVTFTIPDGMNPEQVHKLKWLFELKLGGNIDLSQNGKWFTLEAFYTPISKFDFTYSEIKMEMDKYKDGLPIIFGKSRRGWKVVDMKPNPHLIIAGLTGYGKSSLMNAIITSLMLFYEPGKIDFYFGDPMSAEFTAYKNMAHTQQYESDPDKISAMLKNLHDEMIRRARLLEKYDVEHVDKISNEEERPNTLMIFIDEFIMLMDRDDVKDLLQKIGSAGRKVRMFMVLACITPHISSIGQLRHNVVIRFSFRQGTNKNSTIALGDEITEAARITEGLEGKGRGFLVFDGIHEVQVPKIDRRDAMKLLSPYIQKKPVAENLIIIDRTQEEKPKKHKKKAEFTFME